MIRRRFIRYVSVFVTGFLLLYASPAFSESDSKCQERLEKAMAEDILEDQLKGLKRAAKRCKKYAPVQSALAEFYLDHKSAAHEDWLKLAIHQYEAALKADPALLPDHWELGSLWAVLGEYERASVCFERLTELSAPINSEYPGPDAAASCLSACRLMASLPDRPEIDLNESGKKAAAKLLLMDVDLINRAEWAWLKQWVCAIAVAGSDSPEAYLCAHLAGCQIIEFEQRPYVQDRVERMLKLSGMIAHLSTIMHENQLTASVDKVLSKFAKRPALAWPAARSGDEMETQFSNTEPDTMRTCEFSAELKLLHVWRTPDLEGIWNCRAELAAPDKEITPVVEFEVELTQQLDSVLILFPPIEGYVEEQSLLVLLITGRRLSTVYWQSFAGRRDSPEASITGSATLSTSYTSMEGPFAISREMDLDSKQIFIDINKFASAGNGPGGMISQILDNLSALDNSRVDGGLFTFTRK